MSQAISAPSTGLPVSATGKVVLLSAPWVEILFYTHREVSALRCEWRELDDADLAETAESVMINLEACTFPEVVAPLVNGAVYSLVTVASVGDTLARHEASIANELAEAQDYLATAMTLIEVAR